MFCKIFKIVIFVLEERKECYQAQTASYQECLLSDTESFLYENPKNYFRKILKYCFVWMKSNVIACKMFKKLRIFQFKTIKYS